MGPLLPPPLPPPPPLLATISVNTSDIVSLLLLEPTPPTATLPAVPTSLTPSELSTSPRGRLRPRLMLSTPATATDLATPGTPPASTPPATPPSPAQSSVATPPAPLSAATAMVVASPATDTASTRPAIASSYQQAQKLKRKSYHFQF